MPHPRVIKRRNNQYMLPQSPESPSPRFQAANKGTGAHDSDSRRHSRAPRKKHFVHVDSKPRPNNLKRDQQADLTMNTGSISA